MGPPPFEKVRAGDQEDARHWPGSCAQGDQMSQRNDSARGARERRGSNRAAGWGRSEGREGAGAARDGLGSREQRITPRLGAGCTRTSKTWQVHPPCRSLLPPRKNEFFLGMKREGSDKALCTTSPGYCYCRRRCPGGSPSTPRGPASAPGLRVRPTCRP